MIQDRLAEQLREAAVAAAPELELDPATVPEPELSRPRLKEHGDWSTNLALVLAPRVGWAPRAVAEALVRRLHPAGEVSRIEVAGPGFINLFLKETWLLGVLEEIITKGSDYGRMPRRGRRVQVEFVSANPTGPLHVGTARNAALGDSVANVLDAAGYDVEREYYWNDTGTQMEVFATSVEARYLQQFGRHAQIPEGGYEGEYLVELTAQIAEEIGDRLINEEPRKRREFLGAEALRRTLDGIVATLERFGIRFDSWRTESELERSGLLSEALEKLREGGYSYEAEGALWFRSTMFGDDKDRVLVRSNGLPTYFAKDCGYLLDKASRGFERMVYVWGADHHGDVKRMLGAAEALGIDPSRVQILLYQLVSLYRGGEPVRMSKRTGDVITLDELIDEVGSDAARYTLVSRSSDSPLDFDIELVKRQSLDNPVYYSQYAHARIASLLRVAAEQGVELPDLGHVRTELLTEARELDLLRKLSELPEVVQLAAGSLAPHRIAHYCEEVAASFHRFYTECRVITDDAELTHARLWLSAATKQVVATALSLIGVTAPEAMARIEAETT